MRLKCRFMTILTMEEQQKLKVKLMLWIISIKMQKANRSGFWYLLLPYTLILTITFYGGMDNRSITIFHMVRKKALFICLFRQILGSLGQGVNVLFGQVHPGAGQGFSQNFDRLVIGHPVHRERDAVLAAVGKGIACRVAV